MEPERNTASTLEDLIRGLPDKLYKINLNGGCMLCEGPQISRGFSSVSERYLDLRTFFPPSVVPEFLRTAQKAVLSGQLQTLEFESENVEGEAEYFEARFIKTCEEEVFVIVRDITEATKSAERIKALKKLYENIIDHVNVDIAVLDDKHRYVLINQQALKSPHLRKWIIGKNDSEYSRMKGRNTETAEARMKMYTLADELQEPVEWVEDVQDDNGNKRFVVRTLKPFKNGGKEYKLGYGVDVTALKVVQDELQRREHLLAFSHKLAKIGYWVYYPGTTKQEWSQGIFDLFEIERGVLPSISLYYSFVHPDDIAGLKERRDYCIRNNTALSVEYRVITGTGKIKYIKEESSRSLTDTEEYIFGVIQDITEIKLHMKEREDLLREINSKYNDLMQFNYIVSHNLRSPVANILGMTSLFSSELGEEERMQIFQYIAESAESIDVVIKDLNRILSVKSVLNEKKEEFSLSEIIHKVCSDLSKQISESKAVISVDIHPGDDMLYSIRGYIHSIIYNLISNAIKYRSTERLPEIKITAVKDNGTVLIKVQDNGMGIDLNRYQGQIFGLYKRFTSGPEGRGLGLHMTKAQIESLGGTIHVDSTPGLGTTFTITFKQ